MIKPADIGAIVAYEKLPPGMQVSDLYSKRDGYTFTAVVVIPKASLAQQGLPGPLGDALLYQAPPEGQVTTEADSLVMNLAELLGVINEKDSILNAIETLQKIRLAACFVAGLPSDAPSDDVCKTLYAIARPKPAPAPIPAGDEPVRVLRVIEYTGPRTVVEEQVRRSLHGTRDGMLSPVGRQARCQITAVTLGEYPEVLERAKPETRWQCPACDGVGFTPKIGYRASGEAFLGCDFCTLEDSKDRNRRVASMLLDTPPPPVVESAPQPTPPASEPESAAAVRSDVPDPEIPF